jgi:hypothetical protein
VESLARLIRRSITGWNDDLEVALFGAGAADDFARLIVQFTADHLGPPVESLLYRPGVGLVVGLGLADGRDVLVKIHRWNASTERLTAVQSVQRQLHDAGLPAPRPLLAPTVLGHGIATVEEYRSGDIRGDGRDPEVRMVLAAGLFDLVSASRSLELERGVGTPLIERPPGAPLWPEPHDLRFDFDATSAGAAWIDELAASARDRLADDDDGPRLVGHFDWRVENLGFRSGAIAAIYDWDSVAASTEPVLVGSVAGQFCADWGRGEEDPLPTFSDMQRFVEDYERARGREFDDVEREALDAANLFLVAYGARCQHSDQTIHPELGGTPGNRWLRLLGERGHDGLVRRPTRRSQG